MIAQKQESSVQFSRLIEGLFSPAEGWPLVVSAAFLAPRDGRLSDGNRAQPSEAAQARDGTALALMRDSLRARLFRNSLSRML